MVKRTLDISITFFVLLALLPVAVLIAFLIRIILGGPIFFFQVRPGLRGKPFTVIKFRTMRNEFDSNGQMLADIERLTLFGRFLRATSLDEIPQLLNVLMGHMSLVGPRPLLMEYLPLYSAEQYRRHDVKPGITGWAQVNGRNAISWEEKFILDVWYVDNQSFFLDIKILLMTIKKVFIREGISADGEVTMSRFRGSIKESIK